jgi:hypothetical protein
MQQKPSKEAARAYMQQRQRDRTPPPSIDEIRRQLGWPLMTRYNR